MELLLLWTIRALLALLKWATHDAAPPVTLTTLSIGTLIALAGFGLTLVKVKASPKSQSMLTVLALWAIACLSALLWLRCLLALHSVGLT